MTDASLPLITYADLCAESMRERPAQTDDLQYDFTRFILAWMHPHQALLARAGVAGHALPAAATTERVVQHLCFPQHGIDGWFVHARLASDLMADSFLRCERYAPRPALDVPPFARPAHDPNIAPFDDAFYEHFLAHWLPWLDRWFAVSWTRADERLPGAEVIRLRSWFPSMPLLRQARQLANQPDFFPPLLRDKVNLVLSATFHTCLAQRTMAAWQALRHEHEVRLAHERSLGAAAAWGAQPSRKR